MCGIAGGVAPDGLDPATVRAMCDLIVHRGPDGEGMHADEQAVLGMRRLAIVDVAGGWQPVYNEDRSVVAVLNGEIYNYAELRAELMRRGHRLVTEGDAETLVHLYEEYGDDLVHQLRGMFAFAVWDVRRRRMLLVRDRVGKKPLYYRCTGARLWFGSELKCLVEHAEVPRRLDLVALHHYLAYQYVPAPWSIYSGIAKLPPGHLLVWQDGVTDVRRYWQVDFTPAVGLRAEDAAERLRELLLDAVRVRLIGERPIGAFLSGGVDSAAVVAAMARLSNEPVRTFSIGFAEPRFDERRAALDISTRYGTSHTELLVEPSDVAILPTLAWHFDEPFADSSAIACYYLSQLAGRHVTVALSGDGGDECFGGYRRYEHLAGLGGLEFPGPLSAFARRVGAATMARSLAGTRRYRVGQIADLLGHAVPHRHARLMSCFTGEQKAALYTDELREHLTGVDSSALLGEAHAGSRAADRLGRVIDADINTYLPGDLLAKVDITSMAHSLEVRSPFLDQEMLAWAAALPSGLKLRAGETKWLLKQAMRPWLPAQVLTRPKSGFSVPLAGWLRTDLRDLTHDLLTDATARARGLFRPAAVADLLNEHGRGADHAARIWALLQFELWHRTALDRSAGSGAPDPIDVRAVSG